MWLEAGPFPSARLDVLAVKWEGNFQQNLSRRPSLGPLLAASGSVLTLGHEPGSQNFLDAGLGSCSGWPHVYERWTWPSPELPGSLLPAQVRKGGDWFTRRDPALGQSPCQTLRPGPHWTLRSFLKPRGRGRGREGTYSERYSVMILKLVLTAECDPSNPGELPCFSLPQFLILTPGTASSGGEGSVWDLPLSR